MPFFIFRVITNREPRPFLVFSFSIITFCDKEKREREIETSQKMLFFFNLVLFHFSFCPIFFQGPRHAEAPGGGGEGTGGEALCETEGLQSFHGRGPAEGAAAGREEEEEEYV